MFVLEGSLPATRETTTGLIAPTTFRLWNTDFDAIPASVALDPYGNFFALNFAPVEVGIGQPTYFGRFYKIATPFSIKEIETATSNSVTFNLIPDPSTISPASGYFTARSIFLYADTRYPLTVGNTIAINCWAVTTLPLPSSGVHTLSLSTWGTFTVTLVVVNGYVFNPAANPGSPVPGEFTQSGSTISLQVGTQYSFPSFTQVWVKGTYETEVTDPIFSVASFDLSEEGITLPDQIDYMGHALSAITDPDELHDWGFFWSQPVATLILPVKTWITPIDLVPGTGDQVINSIQYVSDI